MFNHHKVEIEWGGRPLILETGKMARQADGAVLATYGETVVLATVVSMKEPKPGLDFFPLTVNYQEKTYAAGKIPGGYFKREGRPSEKETLVSRLIDRPIRPLFADGYKPDTQVVAKEPRDFTAPDYTELEGEMLKIVGDELREAYKITDKQSRYAAVDAVKAKVKAAFAPAEGEEAKYASEQIGTVFKELQAKVVRWNILDTGSRIDGRDLKTVRKIVSEVGVLPRTHGSALFTRGETQALVVATLGTGEDEQ